VVALRSRMSRGKARGAKFGCSKRVTSNAAFAASGTATRWDGSHFSATRRCRSLIWN